MVSEDAMNGTEVAVITATDRDDGVFGKIFYSLEVSDDDNSFSIDPDTVSTLI